MKKSFLSALSVIMLTAMLAGCAGRFQKKDPGAESTIPPLASPTATLAPGQTEEPYIQPITTLSGLLLCGISEAPYGPGDIRFLTENEGIFRYHAYGAEEEMPEIPDGFDASQWPIVQSGDVITDTDCRNIVLVATDEQGVVISAAYFPFVPGVIYGYANPDQFDDPVHYLPENPTLEDDRAVRLAANLFKSNRTGYYGSRFGYIVQGFLTKYSEQKERMAGYYHTGTDFTTEDGRAFYAPMDGQLIYAGTADAYHTLIFYNEHCDLSLLILHGEDVSPAQQIMSLGGGVVHAGDLLGFGGGAGDPEGTKHLHIEVHAGKVNKYQNFSRTPDYTRMGNYDPLILADLLQMTVPEESTAMPVHTLGTDAFSAQNAGGVCQVGNWLYYINKTEKSYIFRSRPDGSEKAVICQQAATNLNYDEGYVYFANNKGLVCRVKADGSEKPETLSKNRTESYLLLVDDWLYFPYSYSFYRVKKDGSAQETLLSQDVSHVFYYQNGFYYTRNARGHGERIWYYDIEKNEATQILQERIDRPFVFQNQLCARYYYSEKNGLALDLPLETNSIVKGTKIIPEAYNHVQPGKNYLVFTGDNDASQMYVVFAGEKDMMKLTDEILCSGLTLCDRWLYYYTPTEKGNELFRIRVESLHKQAMNKDGLWTDVPLNCDSALYERFQVIPPEMPEETPAPTDVWKPATATPKPTATPEATEVPEATEAPETSEAPETTGTPENTEAPEATEAPETTETPEATQAPETTQVPEPTASPAPTPENTPQATEAPAA